MPPDISHLPQKIPSCSFLLLYQLSPIPCCTKGDGALEWWLCRGHTLHCHVLLWTTLKDGWTFPPIAKGPSCSLQENKSAMQQQPLLEAVTCLKTQLKPLFFSAESDLSSSIMEEGCSCS